MRDLIQFVRQLWEDRLQSVEDFTKENNLTLEEALQMRNKELEGCMKDLESQTDALLEALEEADSLLASPRRADEQLHRKLALGECLQRLGKQEQEAERAYDQEKVEFLRQARQLLIDSFQGDSPVLSASSLVDAAPDAVKPEEGNTTEQEDAPQLFPEAPGVTTEEQDMQTEATALEEAATQTRKLIAKKMKALKKQTDQLTPRILRREKSDSKSPKRSPRLSSPDVIKKKHKAKKAEAITPQYINARLGIRAPSPRRHRLPWESATEEDGDDGYTSTDLSPVLPPQPNNSAVSLAEPSDDNLGFETAAEETTAEPSGKEKKPKQKERKISKSPKRAKGSKKSKSPSKRTELEAADGAAQQPAAPAASTPLVADMGQGEGGRPRRRRSKTQRAQLKSSGAAAAAAAESSDEEGERRRRAAEPHGDGGRPALSRRRSPRTAGDGSERRTAPVARGARTKHALSPPPTSHVYCLTAVPQPADLSAVAAAAAAAAAAAQSDSKLLQMDIELGAKQRVVQPRPTRRKRCSGGGDTMSVQSFNSAEDGRGRSAQDTSSPRPQRSAPTQAEAGLYGAVGGDVGAEAAEFQWGRTPLELSPVAAGTPPSDEHNAWMYGAQRQRSGEVPPADGHAEDTKQHQMGGDDSGFQSEVPPRSPAAGAMYVPPLPLPLPTTSDVSEAASPQPRPKSDTEISGLGTPRSARSPSRGGVRSASPSRMLERSFSCEVPSKKQRCAAAEESAPSKKASQGSGDQPPAAAATAAARRSALKVASEVTEAEAAPSQGTPSPPASPSTGYTPQSSPGDHTTTSDASEFRDCAGPVSQPTGAVASAETAVTPTTSTGPVSPASPIVQSPPPAEPAPALASAVAAKPSSSNTSVLRRDYEQLRTALAELKELQTSFQKDFAANEQAKEASSRLQSDIQRMETSIQELQGIVSQEYEQTRLDHEETRAAIEQIETRVEESERATQAQLRELHDRLEQIANKMSQLEGDVKREKKALSEEEKEEGANAPNVLTLSSMLTRLETEVITLRHEVDSNRHSIDSITSVTQLDSPKPSPGSGLADQSHTSDWQETTTRTDGTQASAPVGGGDASEQQQQRQQQQQPVVEQRPPRPEADLDSFRDSNSDLMSTAEEGLDEEPPRKQQQPAQQQPASQQAPQQQQQQQHATAGQPCRQQRQRASQTDMPEQRRPAVVSPLRMVGGRRSISCCKRHQPEVLRQLRQMQQLAQLPAASGGGASKRSRSAAPPGARPDESEYDSPLQDYWAADLSTASASTEAPRLNESTRVHHGGSSRHASGHSEERQHKADVLLNKLDGTPDTSDKLDQLQHKLLSLRRRVLLSMYRRQRRRAVSEGPRGRRADQQQQRRRAQLAAIDRRLKQRIHGWNRRLLTDAGGHGSSTLSPGDIVSDSSVNSREFRHSSELASDSGSPALAPAAAGSASQRAASEYLQQLSHMLASSAERDERKARGTSSSRHRDRTMSPPTRGPSASETRASRRHHRPAAAVHHHRPGERMERFARNESKLVELQEYLGGIRQHLQRMASELDSPPSAPLSAAAAARGARGVPVTQAVVFRPWTRRHRSVSSHTRPMVSLRY